MQMDFGNSKINDFEVGPNTFTEFLESYKDEFMAQVKVQIKLHLDLFSDFWEKMWPDDLNFQMSNDIIYNRI